MLYGSQNRTSYPSTPRNITKKGKPTTIGNTFQPSILNIIDRRNNIRTILKYTRKIQETTWSVKDPRVSLFFYGIYQIPCSCGKSFNGTTKHSIAIHITEHKRKCRLLQSEKSAIAKHILSHKTTASFTRTPKPLAPLNTTMHDSRENILKFTDIQTIGRKKEWNCQQFGSRLYKKQMVPISTNQDIGHLINKQYLNTTMAIS